jgi:protein disulfide-isomerase/protein disulfide isomerase family A protein 5
MRTVLQIAGIAAAIDATKEPEIAARYNIRGYPTVKYFKAGEFAFDVNVRDAAKIMEFMRDPREPPPPPPPEVPWSEEPSEVVHLTEETFKTFLKKKKHVLVMFYAPCKYSQESQCSSEWF